MERPPLRILYLNPFSQQVSGPDESLLTLLRALIPLGVEAHVVLPRPGPQVSRYEALGVKVHYAPLTVLKRKPDLGVLLLPFRLVRGVAAVVRLARRERVDLIHTNMEVILDGALASRLLRMPHVLHYRGNTNDKPKFVFDILTRLWTATAEKVVCISNATAEIFRKRSLGEKVHVVYNGVDMEAFASARRDEDIRRELGARHGALLVGTAARIHPRKDIATFIRAASLVIQERPDARFVVIGSAEAPEELVYASAMRRLAASLGLSDHLVWAGVRQDMPRVLKALDVFVLSSRHEGFGRVVAEAMVGGIPTVVTREGALPELVAGWPLSRCASPADPREFARGILDCARFAEPTHSNQSGRFRAAEIAATVAGHYRELIEQMPATSQSPS